MTDELRVTGPVLALTDDYSAPVAYDNKAVATIQEILVYNEELDSTKRTKIFDWLERT
jgi:hypothetical protein